jgi:hypothetical protein
MRAAHGSNPGKTFNFYVFEWMTEKKRSCDGGGGDAQRPVLRNNEPKKTGACSAHGRVVRPNPTSILYRFIACDLRLTVAKTKSGN